MALRPYQEQPPAPSNRIDRPHDCPEDAAGELPGYKKPTIVQASEGFLSAGFTAEVSEGIRASGLKDYDTGKSTCEHTTNIHLASSTGTSGDLTVTPDGEVTMNGQKVSPELAEAVAGFLSNESSETLRTLGKAAQGELKPKAPSSFKQFIEDTAGWGSLIR
ncbi:MAG: hypothetical protein SFW64_05375 [Alphaproteobacteria bacterium]|nr:hypothetical protein [Alphaproteobacteria bacterium]